MTPIRAIGLMVMGVVACAGPALAQELLVRPGAQPTTRPATTQPAAVVATEAAGLVDQVGAAYKQLKSLEMAGTLSLKIDDAGEVRTHETAFADSFSEPNKFRHEVKDSALLGSTGQKVYGFIARRNSYVQGDAPDGRAELDQLPREVAMVLAREDLALALAIAKDPVAELRSMAARIGTGPDQQIDGKAYAVLQLAPGEGQLPTTLLVDKETHLVRRVSVDMLSAMQKGGRPDIKTASFMVDYTKVAPNAAVKDEQFAWAPPPGSRQLGGGPAVGLSPEEPATALVGKPAPDFTLEGLDGKPVSLASLRGSVVVLDFWATWCPPCVASMPQLDGLYREKKDAGLKMLAVNQGEDKEKVEPFIKTHNLSIPVVLDKNRDVGEKYQVRGIPTTVIIGKDGTVKKVNVGFNPQGEGELKRVIEEEMGRK